MDLSGTLQVALDLIGQIALGPSDEGDMSGRQLGIDTEVGVPQVKDEQATSLKVGGVSKSVTANILCKIILLGGIITKKCRKLELPVEGTSFPA